MIIFPKVSALLHGCGSVSPRRLANKGARSPARAAVGPLELEPPDWERKPSAAALTAPVTARPITARGAGPITARGAGPITARGAGPAPGGSDRKKLWCRCWEVSPWRQEEFVIDDDQQRFSCAKRLQTASGS
ncbi:hypothetical protein EYF80_042483 [Liparis tanakae]|uniref:Uncharacterized protein n=1 Tax=Liparis tanakae TaxID=230148 RepID=A0A4Z2G373_9TELE|nr:hypothetical protein EYF80_042483 [Liparis tanakae]